MIAKILTASTSTDILSAAKNTSQIVSDDPTLPLLYCQYNTE
jgi:hypothetical protein